MWYFLQGMTIKPLVELLEVKRKKRALPTVSAEIHGRVRNLIYIYIIICLGSDITY